MRKTIAVICSLVTLAVFSCSSEETDRLNSGKRLAEKYCSGCHQLPQPNELDQHTWMQFVLPKMAPLLGFRHFESTTYIENDKHAMKLSEWNNIVRYYLRSSPAIMPASEKQQAINKTLPLFKLKTISFHINPPVTSFVGMDTTANHLMFADGLTGKLYILQKEKVIDSINIGTGVSQVRFVNDTMITLSMGVMHPSDVKQGQLQSIARGKNTILLDSLQRPVHTEFSDLNDDGRTDIIISEFGNNTGQLSWFENTGHNSYTRHLLRPLPGATKTIARDFNHDNRTDIMTLMAQGDEGVFIYFNQGNGQFREQRLLQFSPAHGSNYFELSDINGDGHDDLLITNGDNGDYPAVLKPYHGIRIYLNNGKNSFSEKIFLPVNGACKAIVRDFDEDGDADIASISYFPDYEKRPEESFIYWENEGNMKFRAHTFPGAAMGRWLVMDAVDTDNDGDTDIILGSAKMAMGNIPDSLMKKWNQGSLSVIVLENILK